MKNLKIKDDGLIKLQWRDRLGIKTRKRLLSNYSLHIRTIRFHGTSIALAIGAHFFFLL